MFLSSTLSTPEGGGALKPVAHIGRNDDARLPIMIWHLIVVATLIQPGQVNRARAYHGTDITGGSSVPHARIASTRTTYANLAALAAPAL